MRSVFANMFKPLLDKRRINQLTLTSDDNMYDIDVYMRFSLSLIKLIK